MKPEIKQSIIDDFEKAYARNCDQTQQRRKNRNVSPDSQFDKNNVPPIQHLVNEKILEKPNRLDVSKLKTTNLPLAGHLTEIGEQILKIGAQQAKFICTGNWDNLFEVDH